MSKQLTAMFVERDGSANDSHSLVNIMNGRPMTNSLLIAQKFNKRHVSVKRAIHNLECSKIFTERNFVHSEYSDTTGRAHPMYHLTKDGFVFLVMAFTGGKAARLKEAYINEFNRMHSLLARQQSLLWRESRERSIESRRAETDAIQKFIDYAISQGSKSAQRYYGNFTTMTHRALFIMADVSPTPFRDILNTMQLSFLSSAEYLVRNKLNEGMALGLHYKDIYKLAKDCVVNFACTVGVTPLCLPEQNECIQSPSLPDFGKKSEAISGVFCKGAH